MRELAQPPALLVCDIEGYELSLLDPRTCPGIQEVDLLVEIHEFTEFGDKIEPTLRERFAATHEIQMFEAASRAVSDAASLFPEGTSPEVIAQAMEEHGPKNQHWLWMKRRSAV